METNTLTSAWVDFLTSAGMGFIGILLIVIPLLLLSLSDRLDRGTTEQQANEDLDSTL